ncbi:MAG: methyltransferase domain-containing protein [Nanoarchaeota archaeon]
MVKAADILPFVMAIKGLPHRLPEFNHPLFDYLQFAQGVLRRDVYKQAADSNARNLTERLSIPSGLIVDAGCGTGEFAHALAEAFPGADVRGIDLDEKVLAIARERYFGMRRPNLQFERQDALQHRSRKAELITLRYVLHEFNRLEEAAKTMYGQLLPGGHAYFLDLNREFVSRVPDYFQLSGFTIGTFYGIHVWRQVLGDGPFMDNFLSGSSILAPLFPDGPTIGNKEKVRMANSLLAAYTPSEVEAAFKKAGFTEVRTFPFAEVFDGYAKK